MSDMRLEGRCLHSSLRQFGGACVKRYSYYKVPPPIQFALSLTAKHPLKVAIYGSSPFSLEDGIGDRGSTPLVQNNLVVVKIRVIPGPTCRVYLA